MEKAINAFRQAAKFCTPISANVLCKEVGESVTVSTTWTQNNIDRKIKMTSEMFHTVNLNSKTVISNGCSECSGCLISSYSPSTLFKAVVREIPAAGKTPKKQYIEIWKENLMLKQFDLQSIDVHGDIYTDSDFGCFEWSHCENRILYIAERKLSKTDSFLSSKSISDSKEKIVKGNEYLYSQDWGEQQVGKSRSVVVVANLINDEIKVINIKNDEEYFFASCVWAPDEEGIIGVAYVIEPRRLGRVFCTNRPSFIIHISSDGKITKLSEENKSVFGPKVSPDGKKMIWFQRDVGGPHHSCVALMKYDFNLKEHFTVIDVVLNESKCSEGQFFYGLYNHSKLSNCWLLDNKTVVLSTQQRASVKTYLIDSEVGTVTEISNACDEEFSQGVLQVWKDYVICWKSSLNSFPGVYMAKINTEDINNINWISLVPCNNIEGDYDIKILRLEGKVETDSSNPVSKYSAIYFGPKNENKVPLIVWSHGGPHSASSNMFSMLAYFFSKLKFAILMVNYRGSIGAGKSSVDYLLGKIGSSDVSDIYVAQQYILKTVPNIDANKCVLYGGSHGGYLSLHLAGQYPENFISCTALNPVTNLTQFGSSDIPDWAFTESRLNYSPFARMSGEDLERLWQVSPQYYLDKVKIPILLLIGSKDLRVPPHQGINYYYALKELGKVKTKLLLYEDNHSLSQSAHETDFIINTACWFLESTDHLID